MARQQPFARDILIELDEITARLTTELNDPVEAQRLAILSLKTKYGDKEWFSSQNN